MIKIKNKKIIRKEKIWNNCKIKFKNLQINLFIFLIQMEKLNEEFLKKNLHPRHTVSSK